MKKIIVASMFLVLGGCVTPFEVALEQELLGTTPLQLVMEDGLCETVFGGTYSFKPGSLPSCDKGPYELFAGLF